MSSTALIEAIVDGVLTGGVYALMAAGLTLIFGVMDIINIAQGVMVILGAYLSYELEVHAGIGLLPGLLITVPVMFALGVAIEFCFMRRVRDRDRTQMSILVTYAVAIIIEGVLVAVFGVDYQQLSASYVNSSLHIFGFYLAYIYLIGFGLALALLGRPVLRAVPDEVRPGRAGVAAEPDRRRPDRDRRQPGADALGGRRGGGDRRRRHGLRRHQLVQPQLRL